MPWLDDLKAGWNPPSTDLLATVQAWWEPLLPMAPTLCGAVGANCLFRAGDLEIVIDFPNAQVRPYAGERCAFRFDIGRELVETVVAARAVDWSNSLFLSCRFSAWREGDFNEYLYNFFKSMSVERMRRTEAEAVRKLNPPTETELEIELGEYVVQRRCPHRNADLTVFGEIEPGEGGDELVCTLHGWRFDCATGRCLTAADHRLRIRRSTTV
jgi:UDP-MurNAc hydroxylase